MSRLSILCVALFGLLLSIPLTADPSPKLDLHYGVLSDENYFCTTCSTIYLASYWENVAKQRDSNALLVKKIEDPAWLEQLPSLDVLIVPLPRNLANVPINVQEKIKEFTEKGGIVLAQNSYDNASSNMNLFKKIYGLGFTKNVYTQDQGVTLTYQARVKYPGLPEKLESNYHLFYFEALDPAFTPVYTFQNGPVVAVANIGYGGLILFGFSESPDDIGKTRFEILDALVQMTRAPVF